MFFGKEVWCEPEIFEIPDKGTILSDSVAHSKQQKKYYKST
jgi:hypothetical protein